MFWNITNYIHGFQLFEKQHSPSSFGFLLSTLFDLGVKIGLVSFWFKSTRLLLKFWIIMFLLHRPFNSINFTLIVFSMFEVFLNGYCHFFFTIAWLRSSGLWYFSYILSVFLIAALCLYILLKNVSQISLGKLVLCSVAKFGVSPICSTR